MELVHELYPSLSKEWTVRSVGIPEYQRMEEQVEKQLEKFVTQMSKKEKGEMEYGAIEWDKMRMARAWKMMCKGKPGAMKEEEMLEVKEKVQGFVVAPLDKAAGDCVVI